MADETNNPGGPTNPFSSTGPQGPARTTPPSPNVDQLRSAVDALTEGAPALREIAALVSSITAKLEKSEKSADGITKRYREHGNELRQIVAFEDDIEESVKHLYEYQKKMVREGLKAKDYKDVVAMLKEMEKHNETLIKQGEVSPQQQVGVMLQQTESSGVGSEIETCPPLRPAARFPHVGQPRAARAKWGICSAPLHGYRFFVPHFQVPVQEIIK